MYKRKDPFIKRNASGLTAWGVSILIHAVIITAFLFATGALHLGGGKKEEVLSISIEGDPGKRMGAAGGRRGAERASIDGQFPGKVTDITTGQRPARGHGEGGGTGSATGDSYVGSILRKIHDNKQYPLYAQKRGIQGTVKVAFTLKKDGSLKGPVQKVSSSGSGILDEAAVNTIKGAAPFSPFPDGMDKDELRFLVDVDFVL